MVRYDKTIVLVMLGIVVLPLLLAGCLDTGEEVEHVLIISVEGEGTTLPEEGKHTYEDGAVVDITANPDEGWYFAGWTGDHIGAEEVITMTMDDDKVLTANFAEKEIGSPLPPTDPEPKDRSAGVGDDYDWTVELSVLVEHETGDSMDVEFYSVDQLIGTDTDVESGTRASVTWSGLGPAGKFSWYAVAIHGEERARSETWRFLTWGELEEPMVTTHEADDISETSATLHGTLDCMSTTFEVHVYFRWRKVGEDTWKETTKQSMEHEGGFQYRLTDLVPGTDYEFKATIVYGMPGEVMDFATS